MTKRPTTILILKLLQEVLTNQSLILEAISRNESFTPAGASLPQRAAMRARSLHARGFYQSTDLDIETAQKFEAQKEKEGYAKAN